MNSTGIILARVSSEEQERGYSLDSQIRRLTEDVKKRGIQLVEVYKFPESAKKPERRKKFQEVIQRVKKDEVGYLIIDEIDRLTRDPDDTATAWRLMREHGVTILTVDDGKLYHKDSPPQDLLIFNILASVAHYDNLERSKKTKKGLLEKAQKGEMPGHAPEGYENTADPDDPEVDPKRKRRVVVLEDEKKVALVRQAFELYAEGGWSLSTLTEEMNRRGFKTKPTSRHGNAPLTQHGLQKMLKSAFYYGMVKWAGQLFPGKHTPIISKELFDRVQVKLAENCYCAQSHSKHLFFAFKKFLRCGHCGGRMEAYNAYNNGAVRNYYQCIKHGTCPQGCYAEPEIDSLFTEALGEFYLDDSLAEMIRERLKETHAASVELEKKESKRLQTRLTQRKNQLDLVYEDRLNGVITVEKYKAKQVEIQNELKDIEEQIEKLGKYNVHYKEEGSQILELLNGFKKIYLSQDLQGKAQILGVILERCEIIGTKSTNHTGSKIDKDDTRFVWKRPFDTLFLIGQMAKKPNQVRKNVVKGE